MGHLDLEAGEERLLHTERRMVHLYMRRSRLVCHLYSAHWDQLLRFPFEEGGVVKYVLVLLML